MFVRHHIHSIMSSRDAMLKIDDIIDEAIKHNESFCVTDHGSIAGWIDIYNKCKKKNIKPIFGIEAYINKHRNRLFEVLKQINELDEQGNKVDKTLKKKLQNERDNLKKYHHIVIIAKNQTGFHNLIQLANIGYIDGFYGKPTITYDELFKYKEGLIITTACLGSTLNQFLINKQTKEAMEFVKLLKDHFQEDLYLELQLNKIPDQRLINKYMIAFSNRLGVKMCVGSDSHYLHPDWRDTHQDLLLLQNKNKREDVGKIDYMVKWENSKGEIKSKKVDPEKEFRKGYPVTELEVGQKIGKDIIISIDEVSRVWSFEGEEPYLSYEEMKQVAYEFHKEVVKNIDDIFVGNFEIYDKIEDIKIDTSIKLPTIEDSDKILIEKVKQALKAKRLAGKKEYIERLKRELKVIKMNGFSTYFLILADFIDYARKQEIPIGAGRGSGVSSLVAYLLGIHRIDPLEERWNGMPFERFLSLGKMSNKIIIYDDKGNKKEFVSQDKIEIVRNKKLYTIEAKELQEGDEFVKVVSRFSL